MRILKVLLGAGVLAAIPAAANAQWYGGGYGYNAPPAPYDYEGPAYARPLPRDVIVDRLEERGFDDIGRPRFNGSTYTVEATSRRTGPVRLVIDPYDGRVLAQTPMAVARLGRGWDDEGMEIDGYAPRRGGSAALPRSPYDEMPNAPRYRPGEPEDLPRPQAARPPEADTPAPPSGQRARPADPRVAPAPSAGVSPAEPAREQREASRTADPLQSGNPSAMNPDRRTSSKPAPKAGNDVAARPTRPAASQPSPAQNAAPTAPAPSATSRPEPSKPAATTGSATAEAGERKPVRVIEGVTPLNGGAQSSPAPQNNVEASPKPSGSN